MRQVLTFWTLVIGFGLSAHAQSPFEFNETALLLERAEMLHHLDQFDPMHRGGLLAHKARSLANQFDVDPDNPSTYGDLRWHGLIDRTEKIRRMGELDIAEKQYSQILANLRRAQGDSSDLAYLMDYIGEFYLEERKFDLAYATFSEAVRVRRQTLAALDQAEQGAANHPEVLQQELSRTLYSLRVPQSAYTAKFVRMICRLHLMDLLTRLGQLDMAKGDLGSADRKLSEAVSIAATNGMQMRETTNTVYFRSIELERQNKWDEAEKLWRGSLDKFIGGKNALKEIAAFYARRGDLHSAADFARQAGSGIPDNRPIKERAPVYSLSARPWISTYHYLYVDAGDAAMRQILALDAWASQGPDAATAFLKPPPSASMRYVFDHGSDAERARLLKWDLQVISLQMSILLDDTPSPERVLAAYTLFGEIKGRLLATIQGRVSLVDAERGNPKIQDPVGIGLLDQLIETRQRRAHRFVSAVLDDQPLDESKAIADDSTESMLSTALISDAGESAYRPFPHGGPAVPPDAAFIEIAAWERHNKDFQLPPQRVYGAFVVRSGAPIQYVDLGSAKSIEGDVADIERLYVPGKNRSFGGRVDLPTVAPPDGEQVLKRLYQEILRPLEPALSGIDKVYFAPDGALALTPIGILTDDAGRRFIETHTITYLGSWRDLTPAGAVGAVTSSPPVIVANPDFDAALDPAAAVAPLLRTTFAPLDNLQAEADAVQASLHVPKDRVLAGRYARKSTVEALSSPSILHFATHSDPFLHLAESRPAYNMPEYPQPIEGEDPLLNSVIALAGANRQQNGIEDGWLTGLDVSTLHLSGTGLVVLSTCRAGEGTPTDGQGVQGLRSAFTMAGARSLVMSLWPVNDEAGKAFMDLFYSHLSDGPALAVRKAQLELQITMPQFKDVSYWGGYIASGVPSGSIATASPAPSATHGAATTPAASSDSAQTLVHPACYRFSSHAGNAGIMTNVVQIKVGGAVQRNQISTTKVVYDLPLEGNDVLEKSFDHRFSSAVPVEQKQASRSNWIMTVSVEKTTSHSLLSFQFGSPRFPPEQRRLITLEGPPGLLKSLDIPESLPPLSAFTKTTDNFVTTQRIVDETGACTSDFWEH